VRGGLPTDTRLLDDLADMVDSMRARRGSRMPIILLGHSMGGLVAARFVYRQIRRVEGLILSSPAFAPRIGWFQNLMIDVLSEWAPNFTVGNGLRQAYLSHDPKVVRAYRDDRLVHDRISARLARFIAITGPAMVARAPKWKLPTLLMFAGADGLVHPSGSRAFAAAAPRDVVTPVCFETMYHEIFNEPDHGMVFEQMHQWLDRRFPVMDDRPVSVLHAAD